MKKKMSYLWEGSFTALALFLVSAFDEKRDGNQIQIKADGKV